MGKASVVEGVESPVKFVVHIEYSSGVSDRVIVHEEGDPVICVRGSCCEVSPLGVPLHQLEQRARFDFRTRYALMAMKVLKKLMSVVNHLGVVARKIAYEYCADQSSHDEWVKCMSETEEKVLSSVVDKEEDEAFVWLEAVFTQCLHRMLKDRRSPRTAFRKCIAKKLGW